MCEILPIHSYIKCSSFYQQFLPILQTVASTRVAPISLCSRYQDRVRLRISLQGKAAVGTDPMHRDILQMGAWFSLVTSSSGAFVQFGLNSSCQTQVLCQHQQSAFHR